MVRRKNCPNCGKFMKKDKDRNVFWNFWTCDCEVFKNSEGIPEKKHNSGGG